MERPGPKSKLRLKKKKRARRIKAVRCRLTKDQNDFLDFKDIPTLEMFITSQGRIMNRKRTGASAQQQRVIADAIKHARHMALLPFVAKN
jgi:small subunit ribosomal protein S18